MDLYIENYKLKCFRKFQRGGNADNECTGSLACGRGKTFVVIIKKAVLVINGVQGSYTSIAHSEHVTNIKQN